MFRSQSGPGGLSINTASANALSNNQSSNPPASGSLFSKPLFGNATNTSQEQPTTSLFGNAQTQAGATQQPRGSLFGGQQNAGQSTAGGLFGPPQNQQNQQMQPKPANPFGGSLTQQPQAQGASMGGGLFGSTFGQTSTQQPATNTFGGNMSAFGQSQNPSQAQASNVPAPPPSLFSATIGQYTQQHQTVPGVRISVNELRSTTRFNDLHEELQKVIEYVDNFILNKIQWEESCNSGNRDLDLLIHQLPPDVEFCSKQLDTMQNALENDASSIAHAKNLVKTDVADAKLSFRTIQSLRAPQHIQQSSIWATASSRQAPMSDTIDSEAEGGTNRNIVEYFSQQADAMSQSLDTCRRNIDDIEGYLKRVESNIIRQQSHQLNAIYRQGELGQDPESQVKELASALRVFESGILGVAAKVGASREMVQDVMLGSADSAAQKFDQTKRFGI